MTKRNSARFGVTAFAGSVAVSAFVIAYPNIAFLTCIMGSVFVGILCFGVVDSD